MQLRAYIKNIVVMAAVVLISVGCGGGGSSDGAGTDPGFSDNLSGVWTGQIALTGGPNVPISVTINQPVSGSVVSVRNAQGLSGTVSTTGNSFPMSGTKDGNSVNMQFTSGTDTGTLAGNLTDENSMNGNYSDTFGDSGTWELARTTAGP